MAITITTSELQNNYKSYLQSENSNINAFATGSWWDVQSVALSLLFLDLYGNLQLIENSIYPQNSVGAQVDLWLYTRGLPGRGLQTYATIQCTVSSTTPISIAANTIFTSSATQNQYQTLQDFSVPDGSTKISLYSLIPGEGYIENTGNMLSSDEIIIVVSVSTDGQEIESDQSCINRVLQSIRAPISGARETDYSVYCLETNTLLVNPVITDSIIIPSFFVVNSVGLLGIFPLVGIQISDYQLNLGLLPATIFSPYSRTPDNMVLTTTNNYIQNLRLVGLTTNILPNITLSVTSNISQLTINVSLVLGFDLTTIINLPSQDSFGNPITIQLTVDQLIKKETRRAICNQEFGATLIGENRYITLDSLLYALNSQLSSQNGNLAKILTNIKILGDDIEVRNYNYSASELYYTYDIDDYFNILVVNI